MRRTQLGSIPIVVCVVALAVACAGSDATSKAVTASTPTRTKPAHDLRINSELEKYVTTEWSHNIADPADANYAAGVTVTKVTCVPHAGTALSSCVVALSAGTPKRFDYLVADDGASAERAEPHD
jgi:hypothetical protein